jgi:HK97 family phage prohead protease
MPSPKPAPKNTVYHLPSPKPQLEAKSDTSDGDFEGEISGYGAVFGNIDAQMEIVRKGAFTKTIKEAVASGKVALMVKHLCQGGDVLECIGVVKKAEEDEFGLKFRAGVYKHVSTAQETRSKIKATPAMYGASVGYRVIGATDWDARGVRELTELALTDITITLLPANDKTSVEAKSTVQSGLTMEDVQQEVQRQLAVALAARDTNSEPENTGGAQAAKSAAPTAALHSFEAARARRKRLLLHSKEDSRGQVQGVAGRA